MTEPTNDNDIDALLRYLSIINFRPVFHAAVTALVAERNALKERVAELEAHKSVSVRLLIEERDALREQLRLANIDRDKAMERWMDQVTAMLCHSMTHSHDAKQELVTRCDNAIAAMRKGATDAK